MPTKISTSGRFGRGKQLETPATVPLKSSRGTQRQEIQLLNAFNSVDMPMCDATASSLIIIPETASAG